jgi:hypothetical protein
MIKFAKMEGGYVSTFDENGIQIAMNGVQGRLAGFSDEIVVIEENNGYLNVYNEYLSSIGYFGIA